MSSEEGRATRRADLRDAVLAELLEHSARSSMRAMLRRDGGAISLVHLLVLHVMEHEGAQSMRSLSEAIGASQASVTGIVDRMERRSLVRRERDEADRRVVRVVLTDEGRGLLSGFAAERRGSLGELLDELTERELEGLLRGARALRRARERRLDKPEATTEATS
jgi:DNA-binding MarR family transcriptional regulator